MIEASFLAAFLGGLLALLSPCSALLLPAFFAYAFADARTIVRRTALFYLGLSMTLIPLGMGIAAVSRLFYGYRSTLIWGAGLILIVLGFMQLLGRGFSILSCGQGAASNHNGRSLSTFALGATYGFAGFCSGPILGAILTVAAASGDPVQGASLLAVYAAGMAFPLLLLALMWSRHGHRIRWMRGREVRIGRFGIHSNRLISGTMFIVLGATFIIFQGGSGLSALYERFGASSAAYTVEAWIQLVGETIDDWIVMLTLSLLLAAVILLRISRRGRSRPATGETDR